MTDIQDPGTEDRLRAAMSRFTEDVAVPIGLPAAAVKHIRRRRVAAISLVTLPLAAITAISLALTTGSAPVPAMTTAAYVVDRTEAALASTNTQDLIKFAHMTALGNVTFRGLDNELSGTSADLWQYSQRMRITFYGHDGKIGGDFASDNSTSPGTITLVNYQNSTWWHQTQAPALSPGPTASATPLASPPPAGGTPSASSCGAGQAVGIGFLDLSNWPAAIHRALACGEYKVDGSQRVDGVDAIKLEPVNSAVNSVIWIDPSTYLPVREVQFARTGNAVQFDFKWLQPDAANLANFTPPVPSGFTEVTAPVSSGAEMIFSY
jgi:hypothetical protein